MKGQLCVRQMIAVLSRSVQHLRLRIWSREQWENMSQKTRIALRGEGERVGE